ncbi:histidine phosphatase family protein [Bordetella genomosp. 4]|uniref:Histidine phosphatase family protein n=1 Tax=Bordetella genomosp. 4 TaxID=463044 RepID=A0A261UB84_9BORD|nr:histidine phosphatase family protein [Bordetella genomosp. 4]OZI45598.1 histidine phosphatase family protein [Bordetella genomosp. 4]OZI59174.1 histidine phosphatase family protein [Bordetella genomosp. 4]
MTEIWFIRHGETSWNREGRLQGWQDIELNDSGREQAAQLAARMATVEQAFDALYSSDLQRAYATAEPISAGLNLRIRTEPGIRERGFGVLEGLDLARIDELAPEAAAARKSRDPNRPIEGGESLGQFQARVIATINDLAQRHTNERILAVTHGGVLDIIWRHASNVALDGPRPVPLLNASINRIGIEGRQWQVLEWADIAHLDMESTSDIVP